MPLRGTAQLAHSRDCVAPNRGADFVQCLAPPRSARRNKALDPAALVGFPQASLLPSAVLAGQRHDSAERIDRRWKSRRKNHLVGG